MTSPTIERSSSTESSSSRRSKSSNKPRRYRRKLNELEQVFPCPVRFCMKRYGSITALRLHMTMKHNIKNHVNVAPLPNNAGSPLQSPYDCSASGIRPELPDPIASPQLTNLHHKIIHSFSPGLQTFLDQKAVHPIQAKPQGLENEISNIPLIGNSVISPHQTQLNWPPRKPEGENLRMDMSLNDLVNDCVRLLSSSRPTDGFMLQADPDPNPQPWINLSHCQSKPFNAFTTPNTNSITEFAMNSLLANCHDEEVSMLPYF